jgi:hypothetical protein
VLGDTKDTLDALAQNGMPVPPEMIVESSNLPRSKKDKMLQTLEQKNQPDPATETAKQIALQGEIDKNDKTVAEAELDRAKTAQIGFEMGVAASNPGLPGVGAPAQPSANGAGMASQPASTPMQGAPAGSPGFGAQAPPPPGLAPPAAPPPPGGALVPYQPPAPAGPMLAADPVPADPEENVMQAIEFLAGQQDELSQKLDRLLQALGSGGMPAPAAPAPDAMSQKLDMIAQLIAAPTMLVRDEQGRVAGTRKEMA